MASAVPDPTARLIFRTWDDETDTALAAGLWGDSRVTELIGGPFDEGGRRGGSERIRLYLKVYVQ